MKSIKVKPVQVIDKRKVSFEKLHALRPFLPHYMYNLDELKTKSGGKHELLK